MESNKNLFLVNNLSSEDVLKFLDCFCRLYYTTDVSKKSKKSFRDSIKDSLECAFDFGDSSDSSEVDLFNYLDC